MTKKYLDFTKSLFERAMLLLEKYLSRSRQVLNNSVLDFAAFAAVN